ncbi:hypothetical protein GCM10009818_00040 [Nakamurella flavida]
MVQCVQRQVGHYTAHPLQGPQPVPQFTADLAVRQRQAHTDPANTGCQRDLSSSNDNLAGLGDDRID